VQVLEAAGYRVLLPQNRACCGRPAFSRGMLDEAAAMGRTNLAILEDQYPDLPIVFLEPSCLSMFIDDYLQLRLPGAAEVAPRCVSFEAFVDWAIEQGRLELQAFPKLTGGELDRRGGANLAIHAHCHAKALTDVTVLKRVAQRIPGATVTLLDTACCGMAGAYGMLKKNYELSLQVAEPMLHKLRALPENTKIIASGTSCRHQIRDLLGGYPYHMSEILALTL
jgi:Fe-S oxidoreductase